MVLLGDLDFTDSETQCLESTVCLCDIMDGSTTTQEPHFDCNVDSVIWTVWLDSRFGFNGVLDSAVEALDTEPNMYVVWSLN